ncbi:hypothetical protein BLNAU_12746 [Blattamonas nauphoetae]|uniref:Uncharacterized protein n=1 Tax=Blattamonas nauphoetae TaxID=2049346 RepID=A0ABQ9XK12_9EUKA|nr:hypothetical protein BLNAU_12746 [Blattamonas nauphoetae]
MKMNTKLSMVILMKTMILYLIRLRDLSRSDKKRPEESRFGLRVLATMCGCNTNRHNPFQCNHGQPHLLDIQLMDQNLIPMIFVPLQPHSIRTCMAARQSHPVRPKLGDQQNLIVMT